MSTLAERQLAAWEKVAHGWQGDSDGEGVLRCRACGKGIWLETDSSGRPFRYSAAQMLAMTVLHLRNHHQDLDPDQPH